MKRGLVIGGLGVALIAAIGFVVYTRISQEDQSNQEQPVASEQFFVSDEVFTEQSEAEIKEVSEYQESLPDQSDLDTQYISSEAAQEYSELSELELSYLIGAHLRSDDDQAALVVLEFIINNPEKVEDVNIYLELKSSIGGGGV
jgi:hypothetical protein